MNKPISIGQAIARMYAHHALQVYENKALDKPRSLLTDLLNDSPIPVDTCKRVCNGCDGCGTCRTFHSVPHVPHVPQ